MRNSIALTLSLPLLLVLAACTDDTANTAVGSATDNCRAADLLLYNTTVYTANEAQWTAEAVASLDGRIVFVGSNDEAKKYHCGSVNAIDMMGKTVFAGFTDSHQHLEGVGRRTKTLSLFGIPTLAGTVDTIRAWAADIPTGEWVQGRGWIEREWTDEQRFLNKYDVDAFTRAERIN